jgi:GntR family transcriptional regulator
LEAESIHEILVRDLNLPLTQVWQRLEATSLRGRVARLLGVPHRTPGFRLERVTFTFDTPVTWVEYRMRGDRYYFEDVFSPQREV